MFKSSFSKYLTALVVIIFISFLMLSGIITAIIRNHVTSDKINKLEMSTSILKEHFESEGVENLETYISTDFGASVLTLYPLLNVDFNFNIIIADTDCRVILSTYENHKDDSDGSTLNKIMFMPKSDFSVKEGTDDASYLVYTGVIEGIIDNPSIIYGNEIITGGEVRGYVFTCASTFIEDRLIGVARSAVINGSIWVMLAALVAAYFITDRIVHPMKSMTLAAKKFAKGDFSERIAVSGNDEVAELAIAFNHMAESLNNLEQMRNTFLASVSHDLRTPMTTIAGYIDGIKSGAIPPEKQGYYLDIVSGEVHRLSRLVSQLLDVSRLDSGDRKFTFADFDVAELSRQILISFESKLYSKQLDVEFICDEDSMSVNGDKDAIHQVIYNLCHNAIKFSNDGGRFVISINRVAGKKIRVSVYDDGQRLTDEEAAQIFDRFYKSDKSRGLDKTGVGLGLYISKTIIDAHNEDIGVKVLEDGCEFWFTLKEGEPIKHQRIFE